MTGGGAGIPYPAAPAERWSRSLDVNLRGVMLVTQACLRAMGHNGGAIVNIASLAGVGRGTHGSPEYAAAKAGVVRLTTALACLAEEAIRVNCVCPDWVDTPASRRTRSRMTAQELAAVPRHLLAPEDIADAVMTFVTDDGLAGRVLECWCGEPPRLVPVAGRSARLAPSRSTAQNGVVRTLDEAPFVDPFTEEFQADPLGNIDRVRAQSWLARTPLAVLVVAREQVHRLLSDPRLQSALMHLVRLQGVTEGRLYDLVASALLSLDGADHARIRGLVSRAFTPRAVEPYRPAMRALAEELVERFVGAGECEFMADFADHYPIEVMCQLLGVPPEDHLRFARWGDALTHVLSLELSLHLDEVTEALAGLNDYLDELIAERHRAPRQDLVSQLIAAGDDRDRLNPLELRALLGGLLFAGYDTTRNQLALAMTMFSLHSDQWSMVADRPELVAPAVEEVMRVAGVISATPRIAVEDVELDGWHIPAWTLVLLSLSAANHDPVAFDEPHGFDITARREAQLTFGGGPHYCLGANLARAEMQEALPVLARRLGPIALAGEPQWRPTIGTGIFGPTRLGLRFSPAAISR